MVLKLRIVLRVIVSCNSISPSLKNIERDQQLFILYSI